MTVRTTEDGLCRDKEHLHDRYHCWREEIVFEKVSKSHSQPFKSSFTQALRLAVCEWAVCLCGLSHQLLHAGSPFKCIGDITAARTLSFIPNWQVCGWADPSARCLRSGPLTHALTPVKLWWAAMSVQILHPHTACMQHLTDQAT